MLTHILSFGTTLVLIRNRNGFQCPMMCNPAEFFVNVMSKDIILNDSNRLEKKWFPSALLNGSSSDKLNVYQEKEIDLLVVDPITQNEQNF